MSGREERSFRFMDDHCGWKDMRSWGSTPWVVSVCLFGLDVNLFCGWLFSERGKGGGERTPCSDPIGSGQEYVSSVVVVCGWGPNALKQDLQASVRGMPHFFVHLAIVFSQRLALCLKFLNPLLALGGWFLGGRLGFVGNVLRIGRGTLFSSMFAQMRKRGKPVEGIMDVRLAGYSFWDLIWVVFPSLSSVQRFAGVGIEAVIW